MMIDGGCKLPTNGGMVCVVGVGERSIAGSLLFWPNFYACGGMGC